MRPGAVGRVRRVALAGVIGLVTPAGAAPVIIDDPGLAEISGCAISRTSPGIVWVHNDSGDEARLYALEVATGRRVATYVLPVAAIDWEDMAYAPSGDLVVGDIGDNTAQRPEVLIHRVREPVVAIGSAGGSEPTPPRPLDGVRTQHVTYPEGPQDAEALLVAPDGTVEIITKALGRVYRVPRGDGPMVRVAAIGALGLITGADALADGSGVLVRTYLGVYLYPRRKGAAFDSVWKAKPVVLASPLLPQAEAVCADPGATFALTTSEMRNVTSVPLARLTLPRRRGFVPAA